MKALKLGFSLTRENKVPHHFFLIFMLKISSFYQSLQETTNIWATFQLPRGAQAFSRANKAKQMKCLVRSKNFRQLPRETQIAV